MAASAPSPGRLALASSHGQASLTLASPRAGLKSEVDQLFQRVQDHDDAIIRLDATVDKNASIADDSLKAVQASLKASLASLRDEMNRKLQAMTIEIAQLQKQMNVARAEQSIAAQQAKDTSKRVDILSSTVADLCEEVVGSEAAPTGPQAQGAAF